jgi:hypothetical protein
MIISDVFNFNFVSNYLAINCASIKNNIIRNVGCSIGEYISIA